MASHVYVTLEINEARYLADLIGVEYDLNTTIEWCDQFYHITSDRHMFWLVEPLTTAILIRFIRAFGGGVRHKSTNFLLSTLSRDEKEQYDYFKNIRDKHAAHSVNEFEDNEVKAYYIQESIEKGVNSIGEGCNRVIGLSGADIESIRNICASLVEKIKLEKAAEKEKLLRITSKYTAEDIRKFKAKAPKRTENIDVSKSRR